MKFSDFWVVGWKSTKFIMSYLRPQFIFSLNFASLFSFMRDNSSLLFKLKTYMIRTREGHQSAKFQTFDCSSEISPNLYFDRLLLLKVFEISAKKAQMSYVSWNWIVMQNLRKNRFVVSKIAGIWWILISGLKIQKFKIQTLIDPFCAKYITFDLKEYRGVIFHDSEVWCKIWRKTCAFKSDMRNFANIHDRTQKSHNWDFDENLLCQVGNIWA